MQYFILLHTHLEYNKNRLFYIYDLGYTKCATDCMYTYCALCFLFMDKALK